MAVGARQYDRGVRVTIVPPAVLEGPPTPPIVINPIPPPGGGAPSLPQLRVRFRVVQSITNEPQRATVSVWNLGATNRNGVAGVARRTIGWVPPGSPPLLKVDGRIIPGDPITVNVTAGRAHLQLEAGYGAALSVLFEGAVPKVRSTRRAPDWITTLESGDAELQLGQAVANRTFDPGTPASAVLTYLAKSMGVSVVPTAGFARFSGYLLQQGFVAQGPARLGVSDMASAFGMSWWIENGQLWILDEFETIPGPDLVVSPEDIPGAVRLLQSPEPIDEQGIRCRMKLAPQTKPGRRVVVTSSEVAGVYRVEQVVHDGDNRGGPFHTEAILRSQNPLGL